MAARAAARRDAGGAAGLLALLEVPSDRARPAVQSFEGGVRTCQLAPELLEGLRRVSRRAEATLFMTLATGLLTLLYRYTGQSDLLIGTPIAGRTQPEVEGLIGLFVNTLVLRCDLSGSPTFEEALARVREVCLGAYAHQELPFERLVEALQPARDLSYHPLYQVLLILENTPSEVLELPDLSLQMLELASTTARYDIDMSIREKAQGLHIELNYSTALFNEPTAERLIRHFKTLLEDVVAAPHKDISRLNLLSIRERYQILEAWNNTQAPYQQHFCFSQLFEQQVEQSPDRIAISCEGEQITYLELNKYAEQLALQLMESGVKPDDIISLLLDRSIPFIVAILAAFKAGAAFVPLDLQHPAKRHAQILEQSRSAVLITLTEFEDLAIEVLETYSLKRRTHIVRIPKSFNSTHKEEITRIPQRSTTKNLAYIMFTSGSTGIPKGVMVDQLGMLNHMAAKIKDLDITDKDIIAQNGPPSFDIVVWQCLAALLVGARVCIMNDDTAQDPAHLTNELEREGITVLQVVPSMLRAQIQDICSRGTKKPLLTTLRWMVPTGDALSTELCHQWLDLYPHIPLLNTYGSTECSDDQCHYPIPQISSGDPLPIASIGRPIINMRSYILDKSLELVPIGVIGDLYIGGIGVGRGYLHDPLRTAQSFIPDPFAKAPGARLYKTSDRSRYLADGNIEFLGRSDNLIKINGVRIEPGEIEAELMRHPGISNAIVVASQSVKGIKRLAAYVIISQPHGTHTTELRSFLREKLPERMIPSVFVYLDAVPLSANGKVDRNALPPFEEKGREDIYVAPSTSVEHQIVKIWRDVLGIEKVGISDNFFELGGHSLLMIRVRAKLQELFNRNFSVIELFQYPTISTLSKYLERDTLPQQPATTVSDRVRRQKEALKRRTR
jgi:amino acid adenylation domain-containing protein